MAASVLRIAMTFLKPLLTYGLAIWLLFGLLLMARNFLFSSVSDALAPLCHLPGSSYLPFCASPTSVSPAGPVEFDRLISAQSAFEDVLTTSAGGASLPLAMKHSEGSIRDLRQVVQYSNLPSRHELVFEFSGFIETARQASSDLTRYNARIGGAVDRILSTNRWTLQVLDGISASEAQTGALRKFASSHLNILAPFQAPRKLAHEMLLEQYLRHTSAVEEQITSLILEAQALLQILQNLDDRLDLIANIATRDGVAVEGDRDKLFAHLFTKLGGNRKNVAKLDAQLRLLRDVGTYKRLAWAHVSGTIVKLQAIAANLEDLRNASRRRKWWASTTRRD
ncbi:hypothetical protein H2203_001899 [Taxawa tesnikishii (nom. ined.)]|nr:hypothetical protein H2203_001899 [Dothideales sp. JES 119]